MNQITELFNHYGYIVLFTALMLELIALPTPGEALMTYCGLLVFQGRLHWIVCVLLATVGVITGITISYLIGSLCGYSFFKKYGVYIHLGPDKLDKTSLWFKKYGNALLIIAYFIPGVRHITGYFSGTTKIPYKKFAFYSYIGAFLWTTTFISIGKILGPQWEQYHASIKKYLIIGGIIISTAFLCIYVYRSNKLKILTFIDRKINYSFQIFHSLRKVRIAALFAAIIFFSLTVITVGIIQDMLANEFVLFDRITYYIISRIFSDYWNLIFNMISYATNYITLIIIVILSLFWILAKGENRILETRALVITVFGGEILEEILRSIFHRQSPIDTALSKHIIYTFPSEQALMALVTYGFTAFIIIRHIKKHWISTAIILITLAVCLLSGVRPIFNNLQYPSDILAGYVFGGVWLSMNIILLEFQRIALISSKKT